MTVQPANVNPADYVPVPSSGTPERPPKPELDNLDGHLEAYLAQSVKPYRERLADIIRVIDGTGTGKALLDHFRDRARQNNTLVVNLLATGSPMPEGPTAQGLWLNEADLTAGAHQIGVPPEVQYAPSVFQSLVLARNALLGQTYIGTPGLEDSRQAAQDPADLLACFQQELADHHHTVWRPGVSGNAQAREQAREQARLAAFAITQKAQSLSNVPTDPKPGAHGSGSNGSLPHAAEPPPTLHTAGAALPASMSTSDAAETAAEQRKQRAASLPSSVSEIQEGANVRKASTGSVRTPATEQSNVSAATSSAMPLAGPPPSAGQSNGEPQTEAIPAAASKKKRWGRVTQWVDKRFDGFLGTVRRLRTQYRGHDPLPQNPSLRSSDSSLGKTTATPAENKPV